MKIEPGALLIILGISWQVGNHVVLPLLKHQLKKLFLKNCSKKWLQIQQKLEKFEEANAERLFEILNENKDTDLGKQLGFNEIKTVEEFRKKIPVTKYNFYSDFIEQATEGKQGKMCKQKIEYFATSSGTTGRHKMIPVTWKVIGDFGKVLDPGIGVAIQNLLKKYSYDELAKGGSLNPGLNLINYPKTKGGINYGPLSQSKNAFSGIVTRLLYKVIDTLTAGAPSDLVDQLNHFETAMLIHLLFGLADPEINRIFMAFGPGLSHFLGLIRTYGNDLLTVLETNNFSKLPLFAENIPKKIQTLLENELNAKFHLAHRKARAAFLREEFAKGFEGIVPRIWKKINFVSASVSGSFQVHEASIRYFLGALPISGAVYICSEGCLGFQADPNKNTYFLHPGGVFYEFIPEHEIPNENPATVLFNELKIGEKYEILITTISGFVRYRVGDVIEILDSSTANYLQNVPRVNIAYRTGSILDAYGEKTTEIHICEAIRLACNQWQDAIAITTISLKEFTCYLDLASSPVRYHIFIELNEEISSLNLDAVDAHLRAINGFYDHCREQDKLGPLKIFITKKNTFRSFTELLVANGAAPLQVKVPRLVTRNDYYQFLIQNSIHQN